jgi:glycerol-3-phosphate O-acyltransferase
MKHLQERAEQHNTSVTQEIINQLQDHEARQIRMAVDLLRPNVEFAINKATEVAAEVATRIVLAALRDAARPSETELERRLNQLQEIMNKAPRPGKPDEGGEK